MGFPRQEYWSGWPFPFPGSLPDPGIKSTSPAPPALAGRFFTAESPGKPLYTGGVSYVFLHTVDVSYVLRAEQGGLTVPSFRGGVWESWVPGGSLTPHAVVLL